MDICVNPSSLEFSIFITAVKLNSTVLIFQIDSHEEHLNFVKQQINITLCFVNYYLIILKKYLESDT